jgi:hypothetical protein
MNVPLLLDYALVGGWGGRVRIPSGLVQINERKGKERGPEGWINDRKIADQQNDLVVVAINVTRLFV